MTDKRITVKGSLSTMGTGVRGTWIWDSDKMEMVPEDRYERKKQSLHAIQQDTMEPIQSMASPTGQVFDSKSAYRRHLRENGFRETGGEHLKDVMRLEMEAKSEAAIEKKRRDIREDIEKTIMDIKYDRIPLSEKERELAKKEAEKWGKDYWIVKS